MFLLLSLCLCTAAKAEYVSQSRQNPESKFGSFVGFSVVPKATWKSGQFVSQNDMLDLDMETTSLTTYEGGIWHRGTGIKLGVSADVDNNLIGKLNRLMGYIGYGKMILRMQSSKLRGTATWTGPAVAGQPAQTTFDNTYANIDLLYYAGNDMGMYFGLGYNTYQMPVQINGLVKSVRTGETVYGNDVYQDNVDFKTYGFMFGFDTLNAAVMSGSGDGLGFWATSQDKIGVGNMHINDEAQRRLETANGGRHMTTQNILAPVIDYDVTMGLMWMKKFKRVHVGLGAGFNFAGQVVFPMGSGQVSAYDEVAAWPFPYLLHYGPVFKIAVSW
jgi:hypothetical protein